MPFNFFSDHPTGPSSYSGLTCLSNLASPPPQDIITYHMVSSVGVSRGLYLGYLQCQTSVDLIRVSVSKDKPNVLPHVRVRDNPHVSR